MWFQRSGRRWNWYWVLSACILAHLHTLSAFFASPREAPQAICTPCGDPALFFVFCLPLEFADLIAQFGGALELERFGGLEHLGLELRDDAFEVEVVLGA